MNINSAFLIVASIILVGVFLSTQMFGNGLMLIMDRENFLPKEASIFTLDPYVINEGSSSYWLYAEDGDNYCHFTYEPGRKYLLMRKGQPCPGLKKDDVTTWCNTRIEQTSEAER